MSPCPPRQFALLGNFCVNASWQLALVSRDTTQQTAIRFLQTSLPASDALLIADATQVAQQACLQISRV
jgi:hypothetical protein